MHAVVFSTNYRNTDNWMPLFQRIIAEGGRCEAIYLPWAGDASAPIMQNLPLPVRHCEAIHALHPSGISEQQLQELLMRILDDSVDVLFLCDMQTYPSAVVHKLLKNSPQRPLVIGLQHGLFQSWWLYNQNFGADHLLCFGERHRLELIAPWRKRSTAVGLPKLDALARKNTQDDGYILYLAQKVPDRTEVSKLLKELELRTQLPVLVRNHPQYPELLAHVPQYPLPVIGGHPAAEAALIEQIAHASWVLTPHSTGGLEALQLHKPLVLIPNHGLTAWAGYPAIATELSVTAILDALHRAKTRQPEIQIFLDTALGGLRFDHTDRAMHALRQLINHSPPTGVRPGHHTPLLEIPFMHSLSSHKQISDLPPSGFEDLAWLFHRDDTHQSILRPNLDEAALLWKAVKATAGPLLEIGRRHGGSTVLLLTASAGRRVTSIDMSPSHHIACEQFFKKTLASSPESLQLIVGNPHHALEMHGQFGFFLINEVRDYEEARSNVIAHWRSLKIHGSQPALIVFHDTAFNQAETTHRKGIKKLCNELIEAGCATLTSSSGAILILEKKTELPDSWQQSVQTPTLNRRDDVLALVAKGGIGIELGVAEGVLSERLLEREILSHLYSIDMYAGDRGHDDEQYKRALVRLMRFRDKNTLIKLRFDAALSIFPNEYFDFIYVDGYAHTGEEFGETFKQWYPKLKPGGILAGDDYCEEWPLVMHAVDKFLADNQLPLHIINCREDKAYCHYPTWYTFKPTDNIR